MDVGTGLAILGVSAPIVAAILKFAPKRAPDPSTSALFRKLDKLIDELHELAKVVAVHEERLNRHGEQWRSLSS